MEKQRPCYEKRVGSIRVRNLGKHEPKAWPTATRHERVAQHFVDAAITRRHGVERGPDLNGLGDLAQASLALQLAIDWISQRQETSPPRTNRPSNRTE